jgi:hypothetical protein
MFGVVVAKNGWKFCNECIQRGGIEMKKVSSALKPFSSGS